MNAVTGPNAAGTAHAELAESFRQCAFGRRSRSLVEAPGARSLNLRELQRPHMETGFVVVTALAMSALAVGTMTPRTTTTHRSDSGPKPMPFSNPLKLIN